MGYKKIIKLCNERKEKLKNLLDNDSIKLKNEQMNHIQGAIDEIELICLTLQQYQDKEISRNFKQKDELLDENTGIFKRMGKIFSQKKTESNSRNFSLSESYRDKAFSNRVTEV